MNCFDFTVHAGATQPQPQPQLRLGARSNANQTRTRTKEGKRSTKGTRTCLRSSASLSLASISSTLDGAPPPRAPSTSLLLIRRGGALAAAAGPSSAGISMTTGSRAPIIKPRRSAQLAGGETKQVPASNRGSSPRRPRLSSAGTAAVRRATLLFLFSLLPVASRVVCSVNGRSRAAPLI